MADRAQYIARTLIARLANLQASFREDGRGEPDRRHRIEAIEKVLAVELGITNGITTALIEAAAPSVTVTKQIPEQEVAAFAGFLRSRLGTQLDEP
jgi:hypothetical protein